jgi:hypothetical protein
MYLKSFYDKEFKNDSQTNTSSGQEGVAKKLPQKRRNVAPFAEGSIFHVMGCIQMFAEFGHIYEIDTANLIFGFDHQRWVRFGLY